ncbi:WxL protein peptidoglycan domain-containing protein, partial [Bacillus tropicus]|uniref:WxL protein peptidoglycan domain-containing protein n=1 Tax=Bacillus tropicus TaxID=2026188 RepID=UPI0028441AE5
MVKKLFTGLLLITFFIINAFSVYAAEMKFAVTAIIQENQINKSQTYFDLKMQPGQK